MGLPQVLFFSAACFVPLVSSFVAAPQCIDRKASGCATDVVPDRMAFQRTKVPFSTNLWSTESNDADKADSQEKNPFSEEELAAVTDLWESVGDETLQEVTAKVLPTMHPHLIIKLRQVAANIITSASEQVVAVASAVEGVLQAQLEAAKEVLVEFLDAGEIRKLDAAIGRAARQGQLDMAFFTVLDMNLQDALRQEQEKSKDEETKEDDGKANRAQILQHIYTRCQEEVEKTVPPGVALLNKLLRTESDSIRLNQLEHYLCPQKNTITSPDGKEIELGGTADAMVPPSELVGALAGAVKQIRTVENAGGVSPAAAAGVVESCRRVAMEARNVIGDHYGDESEELKSFEEDLEPVFRPSTPDSVYIKGE